MRRQDQANSHEHDGVLKDNVRYVTDWSRRDLLYGVTLIAYPASGITVPRSTLAHDYVEVHNEQCQVEQDCRR